MNKCAIKVSIINIWFYGFYSNKFFFFLISGNDNQLYCVFHLNITILYCVFSSGFIKQSVVYKKTSILNKTWTSVIKKMDGNPTILCFYLWWFSGFDFFLFWILIAEYISSYSCNFSLIFIAQRWPDNVNFWRKLN